MKMRIHTELHYHPKWIEYGFIDEQFLKEQIHQYETGGDKNSEHYRIAAFHKFLDTVSTFDDTTLDRYIELAELDEDQVMAESALGLLAKQKVLTDSQLDKLKLHRAFASPQLQNTIEQIQLSRLLNSPNITDELLERCLSRGKSEVQRKLLSKPELSRQQLEIIKSRGINKAIRNIARDKLQCYN